MAGQPSIDGGAAGGEAAIIQTLVKEAAEPAGFRVFDLSLGSATTLRECQLFGFPSFLILSIQQIKGILMP